MRKSLVATTVVAFLLVGGTATAKSVEYLGSFKGHPDSRISIYVNVDAKGTPKKVNLISYGHASLQLPCDGGLEFPNDPSSYQDLKLKKAGKNFAFSDSYEGTVTTRSIEGEVAGNGKKVTGTIDHEMDFGSATCAVKNLRFTAKPKNG